MLVTPWAFNRTTVSVSVSQMKAWAENPIPNGRQNSRPQDNSKFSPTTFASPDAHLENTVVCVRHLLQTLFGDDSLECIKIPQDLAGKREYAALVQLMLNSAGTADFNNVWQDVNWRLFCDDEALAKKVIKLVPALWERISWDAQRICSRTQTEMAALLFESTEGWARRLPQTTL